MSVRAKMVVVRLEGSNVDLECRYDPDLPEDQRFTKATPWGRCSMGIDNPTALEQFHVGDEFYLDFSKVERVPQGAASPLVDQHPPEGHVQPAPGSEEMRKTAEILKEGHHDTDPTHQGTK